MSLKYLLDENVDPRYKIGIARINPELTVWRIGDPYTPNQATLDPEIPKMV